MSASRTCIEHAVKSLREAAARRRRLRLCAGLILLGVLVSHHASPQTAAPSGDPNHKATVAASPTGSLTDGNAPITQAQAAALLEEMRRLELLLTSRGPSLVAPGVASDGGAKAVPASITLQLRSSDHALGSPSAAVVMVEFADLQCPFCKEFQQATFAGLDRDYIKTGRVRFVVRDLPLPSHPYARLAAEAVRCAEKQGRYWDLREALLADSEPPSAGTISEIAAKLHMDTRQLGDCESQHTFGQDVAYEETEAERLGIRGTPAFLIGRPVDGKVQGVVIQGNRSIEVYRQEIERMMKNEAGYNGGIRESISSVTLLTNQHR